MVSVEIRKDTIESPEARALIAALDDELSAIYPKDDAQFFYTDQNDLLPGHGVFLIARVDDEAIGCGAIRRIDDRTAKLKRMYVVPERRGAGAGVVGAARGGGESIRGADRVVLETEERLAEALALYRKAGYDMIPRFGPYAASPLSLCLDKSLA